jgi:hypothetical protein
VVVMVLVKVIQMQAEPIPPRRLTAAWKTLSRKPLPKVRAFRLSDDDFNYVLQHRRCAEDEFREIEEWGKVLSTRGTDACVFNADKTKEADYIILIRKNPYHSLDKIIVHELSHIARGDL